jgi:hypothetical protein
MGEDPFYLVYILRKHSSIGLWYCTSPSGQTPRGTLGTLNLGGLLNAVSSIT